MSRRGTKNNITIVLKGKANVLWRESRHSKKHSNSDRYYATETYFKKNISVIEGIIGEPVEIPAGKSVYPFTYMLPTGLPPSFESHYGNVRYSVKAILERPWKLKKKIQSSFVIETPPDFNRNPQIKEPAILTMEKTFGFLMFKTEPLRGIVKVPHSEFICGHSIPVTLELNNLSNVAVKGIKFEFNKIKTFHATHPRSKEKVIIKTLWKSHIDCHVDVGSSKVIQENVLIPHFDIFYMAHCGIIDIDYEIKVEVQTVGLHLNMFGNLPVFPMTNVVRSNVGTVKSCPDNTITNASASMTNLCPSYIADKPEVKQSASNIGWNIPKK